MFLKLRVFTVEMYDLFYHSYSNIQHTTFMDISR